MEAALYCLLAQASEDSFAIDPRQHAPLRFLMLRAGCEFSSPIVETTDRYRARVVLVRTVGVCVDVLRIMS